MDINALFSQISTLFANLTKRQKLIIAGATLAVIAFIVFLVVYTQNVKKGDGYGVLFDNISPSDSALVIEQLEKDNVPYRLKNEHTIEVPKEYLYKERITIAAQGIPKNSNIGFELFDKQNFGETDFAQQIKYLRALEGELARTITSLSPILDAKVHIALPKESVFVEKETYPTASVVLTLIEGEKLNSKQIRGIKNLVAASIPKLTQENVNLIDQNGEPLGEVLDDGFESDLIKAQIAYKKEFEKAYANKIEKVLTPILGSKEKVVAKVTIDFDFEQKNTVSEYYDPESVVRSEQSIEEKREGFQKEQKGGVPGAISNIGPAKGTQENKLTEKYEKSSTTTNYEISKKVTNIKGEFAKLKRITAAVVVDGKYKTQIDEQSGEEKTVYIALDDTEIEAIENIVKNAIGFDAKRGDTVTVKNFEFNPLSAQKPKDLADQIDHIANNYINPFLPLVKYLIALALLFIFYKKIIAPFGERMLQEHQVEEEMEPVDLGEGEEEEDETLKEYQEAKRRAEEELGISRALDEEDIKHEVLLDKLRHEIEGNPEEAAKLIKSIIEEEKDF